LQDMYPCAIYDNDSYRNQWGLEEMGELALLGTSAELVEHEPVVTYLSGLAPTGRRAMYGRLKAAASELTGGAGGPADIPWHRMTYAHMEALRTRLTELDGSPSTVNMTLSAVRGVLRACFNLGLMGVEDYQRCMGVKSVKGSRLPTGRCLSSGEIGALLAACPDTPSGHRDAALVALLYSGGLRRSEAVGLDLEDYDQDSGELRVRGKGNKERLLHVRNGAAEALSDWLAVRGEAEGPLFCPVRKDGTVELRHMTSQAVYALLRRLAKAAGVKPFSPHDLRRSFVSELLDRGADIATVQKLAGHANIQTTARYDRRGEEAKRRAVDLLHVPYNR